MQYQKLLSSVSDRQQLLKDQAGLQQCSINGISIPCLKSSVVDQCVHTLPAAYTICWISSAFKGYQPAVAAYKLTVQLRFNGIVKRASTCLPTAAA